MAAKEKKIQTGFRLTPLQIRTISELAKEIGLNRTEFLSWMLDVVVANWESLREAERRRKEAWEALQDPKLRLDMEKYMSALRRYEEAMKIG